ncbi:MAG: hypothetical protein ABSG15_09165 [FCB group bacterium]|jgi:hypothetical protein
MNTFSEIVDAASNLTLDEQESFIEIFQRRIAEEKRKLLFKEVLESEKEFESGNKKTSSIDEIMKEIRS